MAAPAALIGPAGGAIFVSAALASWALLGVMQAVRVAAVWAGLELACRVQSRAQQDHLGASTMLWWHRRPWTARSLLHAAGNERGQRPETRPETAETRFRGDSWTTKTGLGLPPECV